MDLEHRATVVDPEHVHIGQADKDLADACRVLFDGWTEEAGTSHAVRLTATSPRAGDVVPPSLVVLNHHETDTKVSDAELATVPLARRKVHGGWNDTIARPESR